MNDLFLRAMVIIFRVEVLIVIARPFLAFLAAKYTEVPLLYPGHCFPRNSIITQ